MGDSEENSFSNGLGIIVGIVGAILGVGAANNDPEISAFGGFIVGGIIGYLGGWIVGKVLTFALKVLIAIISIIFIIYRVYRLLTFLAE
ncbi:hypothetical protein GWK08_05570 [Leptobacterium flavescens]|uniref:Uncharacterized protein n=1 Tax=Leptobacterium flavescens TaxID=472055 RepID=A0A6P0UM09_9FLAO|nr:hypothetical protein [Leptobacterium flavescens]NER12898.1 hypothetical protein [Leptobacterium flavescens]